LASLLKNIVEFQWPTLEKPQWLTSLTNIEISAPGWVQSLIDLWGGGSSTDSSSFNSEGNVGETGAQTAIEEGRASFRRSTRGGATVIIERLIVNNNQDAEEIAYTIAKRLAYT
jgi:hypothetical protein